MKVINLGAVALHVAYAAECLSNVSATVSYSTNDAVSVSAGGFGGAQVSCPAGTAVAGGVAKIQTGTGIFYDLHVAVGWWVSVHATSTTNVALHIDAVCLGFS
jgi:hypothetical protein